jgi:hypothetical protein
MRKFNIGWIGTGVMGSSMCIRLLDAGCSLNLPLPGLALANQFYISAVALGYENLV